LLKITSNSLSFQSDRYCCVKWWCFGERSLRSNHVHVVICHLGFLSWTVTLDQWSVSRMDTETSSVAVTHLTAASYIVRSGRFSTHLEVQN